MIVKNLSRKNANGSGQLVKYIFKYIFKEQEVSVGKIEDRPLFLPKGIRLSEKDIAHLRSERFDSALLADFKAKYPDYNYKAYIQNNLLPKDASLNAGKSMSQGKNQPEPLVIRHNMRARSLNGFIREFESNERGRIHKRSDQTSIHHTIISWSNKDSEFVTDKMLRDISREYIRLRGENNLYVGTVHTDRAHIHLHIAMSGTTLEGKSARISKQEFEDVKVKLQEYQLQHYPELLHSLPNHGKGNKEIDKEVVEKKYKNERTIDKVSLLQWLETNYSQATSTEHFISLLNQNGYTAYHRNGKLTGIQTEQGLKFRFSRLGVDLEYLMELDFKKQQVEEHLKEIRQLRRQEKRDLQLPALKENSKNEQVVASDNDYEQEALKDIQNIRAGKDTGYDREDDRDSVKDSGQDADDTPDTDDTKDDADTDDAQDDDSDNSNNDDSNDDYSDT